MCVKACNIAQSPKYDRCQREDLVSMAYKFFKKKTTGKGIKNENMSDQQIAGEIHKQMFKKFRKTKVRSPFIDKVWHVNFADMQLINKFSKRFRFLLCAIDSFSKCT